MLDKMPHSLAVLLLLGASFGFASTTSSLPPASSSTWPSDAVVTFLKALGVGGVVVPLPRPPTALESSSRATSVLSLNKTGLIPAKGVAAPVGASADAVCICPPGTSLAPQGFQPSKPPAISPPSGSTTPTDHCDPTADPAGADPKKENYCVTRDLSMAAAAVDKHAEVAKNSVGQVFAKSFFDTKTIPLGSFKPDSTETGWSLWNTELKNVEQWLKEKTTTLWKGYYTVQMYSWSLELLGAETLGTVLAGFVATPAVTAAMVALALYELYEIRETVGEILNEVKALREDLDNLGQKIMNWTAVVAHSENRTQTMTERCQDLMGYLDAARGLQKDGTEGGALDPVNIEFFDEDAVEHAVILIAEDLLGEYVPEGEMYLRAMFIRLKAEQKNINDQNSLNADSFPSLLSRLVALRATYLQIYSYLFQGMRTLWVKALWYGSKAALNQFGTDRATLLQRKTAKGVQLIAAKLTRVAEEVFLWGRRGRNPFLFWGRRGRSSTTSREKTM